MCPQDIAIVKARSNRSPNFGLRETVKKTIFLGIIPKPLFFTASLREDVDEAVSLAVRPITSIGGASCALQPIVSAFYAHLEVGSLVCTNKTTNP